MKSISDKYDYVGEFHQGVAIVIKNNLYGAILMGGHEIITPTYEYISPFKDGYAQAFSKGECIYINLSGKICICCGNKIIAMPEFYDEIRTFYNGVSCVRKQEKWGVINELGEELVTPQFTYISDFVYKVAKYQSINHKWGFITCDGKVSKDWYNDLEIDVDGNLITTRPIRSLIGMSNPEYIEYKKVKLNHKGHVLVQTKSKLISLPSYVYFAQNISEGIICIQNQEGYWGAMKINGELIIPIEYLELRPFEKGQSFGLHKDKKLHIFTKEGSITKELDLPTLFNTSVKDEIQSLYRRIVNIHNDYIIIEIPILGTGKIDFNGNPLVFHNSQTVYLPDWCLGGLDYEKGICYAISKEWKWGIIDKSGKTICNPIYDKIVYRENEIIYTEAKQPVNSDSWKNEKYGLFDIKTKVAIPAEYAEYPIKKENFYLIRKYYNKYGAIDFKGNVVVKPEYTKVKWLNGYFQIFNEEKTGLIKSDGTIIISPQYYKIEVINPQLFQVFTDQNCNTFFICNKEGIINRKYENLGTINSDGNYPVSYKGRSGFINSLGQFIITDKNNKFIPIPNEFKWAQKINEDVTKVWRNDIIKWEESYYYVDNNFNQILFDINDNKVINFRVKIDKIIYENSERCKSFIFQLTDKYGLLSKKGKVIIKPKYFCLEYLLDDMYLADIREEYCDLGKYGIIDKYENIIVPFEYTHLSFEANFIISCKTFTHQLEDDWGLLIDRYENIYKYGIIDSRGKIIFEPIFEKIISFKKGFFVLEDNKWYIIDNKSFTKKETNYNSISEFNNGEATVEMQRTMQNCARCKIDTNGEFINQTNFTEYEDDFYSFSDTIQPSNVPQLKKYAPVKKLKAIIIKSNKRTYLCEPASEGIIWIYENNCEKIGLATIEGEILIEPHYGKVEAFVNGYAKVNNGYWYDSNEDVYLQNGTRSKKRIFSEGKWGIINSMGVLIIPTEYDSIVIETLYFKVTKSILDHISFWGDTYIQVSGYLNTNGELIIKNEEDVYIPASKKYDWQEDFNSKGVSKVYYEGCTGLVNNKYQLIIPSKIENGIEKLIPNEFEWGFYCSEDTFIGVKNKKKGIFHYDGSIIIPAEYDNINKNNDIYHICINGKEGILSNIGNVILNAEFDSIKGVFSTELIKNMYLCEKQSEYGLYDAHGKEILPIKYKYIQYIGWDLFAVQGLDEKFIVFNKNGICVNDIKFDKIYKFGDKNKENNSYNEYGYNFKKTEKIKDALYAIVKKDGYYGAINSMGEFVLPTRYKELYCINRNVFCGDKQKIDAFGRNVIIKGENIIPISESFDNAELLDNELILVKQYGMYGCINKNSDLIIPIQYSSLTYCNGLFIATIYDQKSNKRKIGVINLLNKDIIPFNETYVDIKIENGLILYRVDKSWGAFTIYGKMICAPKFSHIKPLTEYIIKVGINSYEIKGWGNTNETHWGLINIDGEELLSIEQYEAKYIDEQISNGLIKYYVHDRIGFFDITGREVLKPTYTKIRDYIDGYAIVAKPISYIDYDGRYIEKDGYGVMDNSFKEIIPCVFDSIEYEAEVGLFKTDKGYKTPDGRFITEVNGKRIFVDKKYKHCETFQDGYAVVVQIKNEKLRYGLINAKSEDVLPPIFQRLKLCDNGFYKFKINDKYGFIDSIGNVIMPNRYHYIGKFKNDLAVTYIKVKTERNGNNEYLYGLIDSLGKEVLPAEYEYLGKSCEDKVVVMKNNIWKLFDTKTQQIQTCLNVNYLGICKENLCRFNIGGIFNKSTLKTTGGLWGYISSEGQVVISPIYEKVCGFSEGIAAVKYKGKWGFIRTDGSHIVPCEYDKLESNFYDGQGRLVKDDVVYIFDVTGKINSSHKKSQEYDDYNSNGYDDTSYIDDNPYYNDNLDMDQQSIDFWNSL